MKRYGVNIIMALCAIILLASCGYSISASPYGGTEKLSVSVPMASNRSEYSELGPLLTKSVINMIDGTPSITVIEGAPAKLMLKVTNVSVSGGAWNVEDSYQKPTSSASRVLSVNVEAILEKPGQNGNQVSSRRNFHSSRTFLVGAQQADITVLENEALNWVVNDLSQKIAQSMFSEF